MRRFLCQLMLFLIPFYFVGLAILLSYYAGCATGEIGDFDQLVEAQREDHSILIGMAYNEQTPYYKLENANYYQAEIIALGTSRVMQIKSDYFVKDFYNCGGAVGGNYDEYLNFLKNLDYNPQIIILGLDQWVFNDEWNQSCVIYDDTIPIETITRNNVLITGEITKDLFSLKWGLHSIKKFSMNYGFNGRVKDSGYQWDGSYYSGHHLWKTRQQEDYIFTDTFARIDKGIRRFQWGAHSDAQTFEHLKIFLEYCKEKNIEVIGFTPPFAPSVYNRMLESGNYGYLSEISPQCKKIFEAYGYEYFDYTDITILGLDDTYFLDGFHGSEVAYAYIIKDIAEREGFLQKYVDEKKICNLLDESYNHLMIYDFIHKES